MEVCKGNGECLRQGDYENEYYTDPDMICIHRCEPVKCKNFEFCGTLFPKQFIECWGGKGCCINCDVLFGNWNGGKGILDIKDNVDECCVCFESKRHISLPKCNHSVCIECLRKLFWSEEDETDGEGEGNIVKEGHKASRKCPLCRK